MIDVIVYNPSGYALGFIIYHIKHERAYVSYKNLMQNFPSDL